MSEETGFDYGATPVEAGGTDFKNATVGPHTARLRSLIHVGMFIGSFEGKPKPPAPTAIAIFELKDEEDFEEDGTTPLVLSKDFAIKKGDKAFMTKLLAAIDDKGKAKGFDDLIGAACNVDCKAGTTLNEDKTPKYTNFGGVSALPDKFKKMVDPMSELGVGHVRFADITKEAIMELHPIRHVADILMKSLDYPGSKAEEIINAIRKENPAFAVRKATDDKPAGGPAPTGSDLPDEPAPVMDGSEEF